MKHDSGESKNISQKTAKDVRIVNPAERTSPDKYHK